MSAVRLGSNIASLKAQRKLADATQFLSRTYERLSSGMRINHASDDAAGLAIATSLRSDARVYTQGVRNLNDGVSLLNIADGAIGELSSITTRLTELAEQAANGSYSTSQRKALDAEAQALSREYFRIERSTSFNGQGIFFGEFGELRLQGEYGADGGIQSGLGGAIGTGSFTAGYSFDTSASVAPSGIAIGDLNGDGIQDVVATDTNSASVRLGLGNGTFGASISYLTEGTVSNVITLGDLNGDGVLDLVSAGTGGGTGRTTIRLGNGDGTFGAAISYITSASSSRAMVLGDLNNDGILDLVAAGTSAAGNTAVLLGRGDGTFGSARTFALGNTTNGAALGDINGDGSLDLVIANTEFGLFGVSLGRGDGTFATQVTYNMGGLYPMYS